MAGQPFEWNTVVVGAWNPAILVPKGVAKRLLQLEDTAPIEIQISMDQPSAPMRVKHEGLLITPAADRLIVQPLTSNPHGLSQSAAVADRALESLPETPVTAAGINIRYGFEMAPDHLIELCTSGLSEKTAGLDFEMADKSVKQSFFWADGKLNIEINLTQDSTATISFNFHKQSVNNNELRAWLAKTSEMAILANTLAVENFGLVLEQENLQ